MCTIGSDCMCSSYVYSSVYWVELQDSEGSYMILRYAVFMLTLNLQAESINKARYSKPAQAQSLSYTTVLAGSCLYPRNEHAFPCRCLRNGKIILETNGDIIFLPMNGDCLNKTIK